MTALNIGVNFGVHRLVDTEEGVSAHVAAWPAADQRVAVGVGFTRARHASG